jgi:hypothetical protein
MKSIDKEALSRKYASKMELLGFVNPFVADQFGGKKTITFKTERSIDPFFKSRERWETDLFVTIPGVDRIHVPKIKDGQIQVSQITGEVELEEATICHIPGTKSIFVDELLEMKVGQNVTDVLKRARAIDIYSENLTCLPSQMSLVSYLRACSWNKDNSWRRHDAAVKFFEDDKTLNASSYLSKSLHQGKILSFIEDSISKGSNAPLWAIFSSWKNMSIRDCKSRFEIPVMQAELHILARSKPEVIASLASTEHGEKKIFLLEAIDRGHIVRAQDRWVSKEGNILAVISPGAQAIEALVMGIDREEYEKVKVLVGDLLRDLTEKERERDSEIERLKKQIESLQKESLISKNIPAEQLRKLEVEGSKVTAEDVEKTIKRFIEDGVVEYTEPCWHRCKFFPNSTKKDGTLKSFRIEDLVNHFMENKEDYGKFVSESEKESENLALSNQ